MHMPLDYWSIMERLGVIDNRSYDEREKKDEYYYDYAELFNEMAIGSAYLYEDLERLVHDMEWHCDLPPRLKAGFEHYQGATWFDTFASLVSATDMDLLQENEGSFDPMDEDSARNKRLRAVKALKKDLICRLYAEVFNFLMRFIQLSMAYDAVSGIVDELRYLHSFRERGGQVLLPPSAYL